MRVHLYSVHHVGRLRRIIFVLVKYGFDDVVERLELPGRLLLKKVIRVGKHLTTAERVRRALEELGPTFVKFGQVISLRSDLLPAEFLFELRKLHSNVRPVPAAEIRGQIEAELDRAIDEVFIQFDDQPIASASLAQVHRGILRASRQPVAVKVQRPHIRGDIESDVAIMEAITHRLDQRMEEVEVYDLPKLVEEFRRTLYRELDYVREARHMRIFDSNFASVTDVRVPKLHQEYCTEKLLVMELVEGVKLSECSPDDPERRARLARHGTENFWGRELVGGVKLSECSPDDPERRSRLSRRGLNMVVKQILEDGFFHADPHPGNIVVQSDDTLCMLDCGMVGRLTDEMRFKLTELLQATVQRDSDRLVDVLLELTHGYERANRQHMQRDLLDLLDNYHSVPLAQLNLGNFLAELTAVLRHHHLRLPEDLALMIKALITAEGVARELDPTLDVVAEVQPMLRSLIAEQWKPEHVWRSVRTNLRQVWMLQQRLPVQLSQIVNKLERGELAITFQHENLDQVNRTLEDTASRLTVAIIIAAMVIGSSLIITADVGPTLFGYPALGVTGYLISALLGCWVVVNILRSSRW